jgi:general secretion pathway protein A
MYQAFYGLRELPFELTTNPKYLYLTPRHREALSNLEYGLTASRAVTVLTGEAGTGKTTLLNAAFASERCRHVRCVCVNNPALTRTEFIQTLARTLRLSAEAAQSKAVLLDELVKAVREARARGEVTALVIDEAQALSTALLEEIRLLANVETPSEKLLPLVLVGQPALGARLEERGLRQLKQRVALRCEISPLSLAETAMYMTSRIEKAGGSAIRLFTREAVTLIHRYSGGIPRTINVICDNALLHGLALGRHPVQQDIVLDVCRDFSLGDVPPDRSTASSTRPPADDHARRPLEYSTAQTNRRESDDGEESDRVADRRRFFLFGARHR